MRHLIRKAVRVVGGTCFGAVRDMVLARGLTVFVYHDVSDSPSFFSRRYGLNVSPATFAKQVEFIQAHFNLLSPDDLLQGRCPDRSAMVTFDDGFHSVFGHAVAILRRRDIPATIFLNMAAVRGGVLWAALVTWLCERADFCSFCASNGLVFTEAAPAFLQCNRSLVDKYLASVDRDSVLAEVRNFQGAFAAEADLRAADGPGIFYGSHLYDHEVPMLMTDKDFAESYRMNDEALAAYSSYRAIWSVPFGQPGSCFQPRHLDMARQLGAQLAFSSSGGICFDRSRAPLDRVEVGEREYTASQMNYALLRAAMHGRRHGRG
ncbi:MAG: polysaccharide deacetylase family protein [Candidatus Omnitrophica bacterium]|nr:polysaccharide deacetylase family protein [Candidatus Omnitrophota bacterium]